MNQHRKFTIDIELAPGDRLKHSVWRVVVTDWGTEQSKGILSPEFPTFNDEQSDAAYSTLCLTLSEVIGRRVIGDIELNLP